MSEHAKALMVAMARRRDGGITGHPMLQAHENMDKAGVTPETEQVVREANERSGDESPGGAKAMLPHNEMQMTASQMGLMPDAMSHHPYAKSSLTSRAMAEAQQKKK